MAKKGKKGKGKKVRCDRPAQASRGWSTTVQEHDRSCCRVAQGEKKGPELITTRAIVRERERCMCPRLGDSYTRLAKADEIRTVRDQAACASVLYPRAARQTANRARNFRPAASDSCAQLTTPRAPTPQDVVFFKIRRAVNNESEELDISRRSATLRPRSLPRNCCRHFGRMTTRKRICCGAQQPWLHSRRTEGTPGAFVSTDVAQPIAQSAV
jgi:hypothetical protein